MDAHVCSCTYVCVCIWVWVYIYVHLFAVSVTCTLEQVFWTLVHGQVCTLHRCVFTATYTSANTLAAGCAYMCIFIHLCICRICIWMRMCVYDIVRHVEALLLRFSICAYVCICMRMYMCVHVCVYRCMFICMYVYMCMSVYMYS